MTYVIGICNSLPHGVYPRHDSLPLIPSRSAFAEPMRCNLSLEDAALVLGEGFDCPRSRRKKGVLEKCIRKGKKTLKVVAAKSFNFALDSECWILTHVGFF